MSKANWAAAAALVLFSSFTHAAETGAIPMNPLNPISLYGHSNVYLLQNRLIEAAVFPTIGRVGLLNFRGETNVLRFDTALAQASAEPFSEAPNGWRNFGGDWVWPVSQVRWPDHFGAFWPPPWLLDGPAWKAHGWVNGDQSKAILLEIEIGEPLNIAVQRKFVLPADSSTLTIHQRIQRTAPSTIPVTLWNISQLAAIHRVALAVETNTPFVDGYRVLDFTPPAQEVINQENPYVLVMDVKDAGEIKIGSDSPRSWIAAQRGNVVVIEKAEGDLTATNFPDGGCRAELYSNSGLGYSEVETLSEEKALEPGEAIENTLTISLHRVPDTLDDNAFATRIRELVGEQVPAAPTAP